MSEDKAKKRFRAILYTLKRLRVNLEEPTIDKNDPTFLEYMSKELAQVGYELHMYFLDQGDEWMAIRVFDEVVRPFEVLKGRFSMLAGKETVEK